MLTADMASSTVANNLPQTDDTQGYDRAQALYFAAVQEGGGSVLKDYYTFDEYRFRRATFIGNLPAYSKRDSSCWSASKLDADIIFDHERQQLDVQEVRDRELASEFDVLLPLPTTANTQSIDNFKTCPPVDGSRVTDEDQEAMDDEADVPTPRGSVIHSTPGTSPLQDSSGDEQMLTQTSMPEDASKPSEISDSTTPNLPTGMTATELVIQKLVSQLRKNSSRSHLPARDTDNAISSDKHMSSRSGSHATKRVTFSIEPEDFTQHNNNSTVLESVNHATNVNETAETSEPTTPKATEPTSEFLLSNGARKDISAPVEPTQKLLTPPSKIFTPHPDVSSMAHYGIASPIKGRKRQHSPERVTQEAEVTSDPPATTRQASKSASHPTVSVLVPTTNDSASQPDSLEPASKRMRGGSKSHPTVSILVPTTNGIVSQPDSMEPALKDGSDVIQSVEVPAVSTSVNIAENTSPKTLLPGPPSIDPNISPVAAPNAAQRRLDGIISGKLKPKTKREAIEAANELHNRLLARHNAAQSGRKGKGRRSSRHSVKDADPDFMPHYFSPANFPASEKEDGTTRCICGATENVDTNTAMFACEKCGVWQHFACVYPKLRADEQAEGVVEAMKMVFLCSVCDPWGHRDVLKELRLREPVGA